jgi:hypothetical protein
MMAWGSFSSWALACGGNELIMPHEHFCSVFNTFPSLFSKAQSGFSLECVYTWLLLLADR